MGDMTDDPNPEGRDERTGQFKQGVSGNPKGRPVGARTKLGEQFLQDMQADWQDHGKDAIARTRDEKPDAYLKVIASLLPKDVNLRVNPLEEADDAELVQRLRDLEAVIRPFLGAGGGGDAGDGAGSETAH